MIILKIIGWIVLALWSISVIFSLKHLYKDYQLYKIRSAERRENNADDSMLKHIYGQGLRRGVLIFVFEVVALVIILYFLI